MSTLHCYFCGGAACKYENWHLWKDGGVEVPGLYSNWITDDILAMQRPSTSLIEEHDLTNAFIKLGISCIFNLQIPGEHANCGHGIESESGFAYLPSQWMDAGISVMQFGWEDMGTPDLEMILSVVQVMTYTLHSGKKLAVHCHAGLGRTGLAIACCLVYDRGLHAKDAIELVRLKRPGSIQNKKQTNFIHQFENYLQSLRRYYPLAIDSSGVGTLELRSLSDILENQSLYLHGMEQRKLKMVPKIVYLIVKRLKELEGSENEILECISHFEGIDGQEETCLQFQTRINAADWKSIELESRKSLLIHNLLHFCVSLKEPLVPNDLLEKCSRLSSDSEWTTLVMQNMDFGAFTTLNLILDILRKMPSNTFKDLAISRLSSVLSSDRPKDPHHFKTNSQNALSNPSSNYHFSKLMHWSSPMRESKSLPELTKRASFVCTKTSELIHFILKNYRVHEDEDALLVLSSNGAIDQNDVKPSNRLKDFSILKTNKIHVP